MYESDILRSYPERRVKAFDGMAVTAAVWDTAHDFHKRLLEVQTSFAHGSGVLYGLEIVAGEPADRQIYIQPGIAIDPLGRTIILPEQRAYDLRSVEGTIYIVLTHSESQPRTEANQGGEDAPRFIYSEFGLEALVALPQTPYVELGRVRRQGGAVPVQNARNPALPIANEIDLRYRRQIGVTDQRTARMAVVSASGKETSQVQGAVNLARFLQDGKTRLVVDAVPPDRNVLDCTLVYLVGQDAFRLSSEQSTALFDFHRQGGVILYESERSTTAGEPGENAFQELVKGMGITLQPLSDSAALLRTPNFFAAPPDGFETLGTPRILAADGILMSTFDYGGIWQGKRRGRLASRGEIRSALEFGENVVAYALRRRKPA